MPLARRFPLALLLALTACGGSDDDAGVAPLPPTPDSVQVRLPAPPLQTPGAPPRDSLVWMRLVPCPGGSGDSDRSPILPTGGVVGNEVGDTLLIQQSSIGDAEVFRIVDVDDPRHRVVRTLPAIEVTLPATLRVSFARCEGVDPRSLTLVRLHPGRPADLVGGRVTGTVISAPVNSLGDFALAYRR